MIGRREFMKLFFGGGVGATMSQRVSAQTAFQQSHSSVLDSGNTVIEKLKIKVIGIGSGGSNIVQSLWNDGVRYVDLLSINTDPEKFKEHEGIKKLLIGNGESTYLTPEKGRQAATTDEAKIEAAANDGTDVAFILACMGGGTGTGATPIISRTLRQKGIRTFAIIMLPFEYEGPHRMRYALQGLAEMDKAADSVIVISQDNLCQFMEDAAVHSVMLNIGGLIGNATKAIVEPFAIPAIELLTNTDYRQALSKQGRAFLGHGYARGTSALEKAITIAITSPYSWHYALRDIQSILLHVKSDSNVGPVDNNNAVAALREQLAFEGEFIVASSINAAPGDSVSVSFLATGLKPNAATV